MTVIKKSSSFSAK